MEGIWSALASYGLPGAVIALFAILLIKKDQDLTRERNARIQDSKEYRDISMKLQSDVIGAVNKLSDVFEEVKRLIPSQGRRS